MAHNLLPSLTSRDLHVRIEPPQFEPLAASLLGTAASDGDGFAEQFAAVASSASGDDNAGSNFDTDLAAAGFAPGEFKAVHYSPIVSDFGAFLAGGDAQVDVLGSGGGTSSGGGGGAATGSSVNQPAGTSGGGVQQGGGTGIIEGLDTPK